MNYTPGPVLQDGAACDDGSTQTRDHTCAAGVCDGAPTSATTPSASPTLVPRADSRGADEDGSGTLVTAIVVLLALLLLMAVCAGLRRKEKNKRLEQLFSGGSQSMSVAATRSTFENATYQRAGPADLRGADEAGHATSGQLQGPGASARAPAPTPVYHVTSGASGSFGLSQLAATEHPDYRVLEATPPTSDGIYNVLQGSGQADGGAGGEAQYGQLEPGSMGLRAEQAGDTSVYSHLQVAAGPTSPGDASPTYQTPMEPAAADPTYEVPMEPGTVDTSSL